MKYFIFVILFLMSSLVYGKEELAIFPRYDDETYLTLLVDPVSDIIFNIKGKEVLRITEDGRFYANKKLMIENDRRIYELFKRFLESVER